MTIKLFKLYKVFKLYKLYKLFTFKLYTFKLYTFKLYKLYILRAFNRGIIYKTSKLLITYKLILINKFKCL
jgi:hypothetical protein